MRVEHPEGGPYPVVVPCAGVELYVNGKRQEAAVELHQDDQVELRTRDEEKPGTWRLEVTPDGMEAAVVATPALSVRRTLVDMSPSPRLRLEVKEEIAVRSSVGAEEVREALARAGVTFGLDDDAIAAVGQMAGDRGAAVVGQVTRGTRVVVARGRPPLPGRDASAELFFAAEERVPIAHGDQEADLRLRFIFTSAAPGDVLARRHPPEPGQAGTSVRGEAVAVKPPRDLVLVAGRGAELSPDGQEVRAVARGRPVSSRKGDRVLVHVVSELVHPRDVDLSSGHVHFKGDVKVGGSVLEGMEVLALGTVEVGGSVLGGRVMGGGGVRVGRGIISSTVVAGQGAGWVSSLLPVAATVADEVAELGEALSQLLATEQTPPGPALRLLLETRFRQLAERLGRLAAQYAELPRREREAEVEAALRGLQRMMGAPLGLRDAGELGRLSAVLRQWTMEVEGTGQPAAALKCSYAMNAILQATGDILVTGNGCHSSRLLAGGSVRVERIFRGGEIQAGGEVWVGELGSPGVATRVRVPASGCVRLGRAAEDSMVQVGGWSHRFLAEEHKVGLRLNHEGELEFFW